MFKKVFIVSGYILLLIAVFANQIGIDNENGWRAGRTTIFFLGMIITITGTIFLYHPDKLAKFVQVIYTRRFLLIAIIIVGVIYIWVAQLNIQSTRKDYNYYSELARSFKNGHTYLADKPSSALLALDNPYDYNLREEAKVNDFPWDVSLYNQKFYLYWGPSPSLLLSIFSEKQLSQIGDRHLVKIFALGLFIYLTLLTVAFYGKPLSKAPGWLLGLSILLLGLTTPTTIMLQESRVYQVAVFGSQFFFIGGCYWVYSALNHEKFLIWKFVVAGIHWALAIGTRLTITPVILWSTTITIFYLVYKIPNTKIFYSIVALGIPVLIEIVGLGWYNWERFSSIFETGLTYQLTSTNYMTFKELFSVKYLGRNFYLYFFHPLQIRSQFPYLYRVEYLFTNERLGGMFFIAPYIVFAFLPILSKVKHFRLKVNRPYTLNIMLNTETWLLVNFAGSAIIGIVTILAFWWIEMRYLEDFMPSLLLFITIALGREYRALKNNIKIQNFFISIVTILGFITIIASTLVSLKHGSMSFWTDLGDIILSHLK